MHKFSPASFAPELMLASACARWPLDEEARQNIQQHASATLDWSRFLGWVRRHGVGPLVHHNLRRTSNPAVPGSVLDQLQEEQVLNARRALSQVAEAARITRILADAGIRSIIIKGPVLSLLVFGDATLRASRDVDILVDPDQAANADRLIVQSGYRRIAPDFELSPRQHALYQRWRCQFGYYCERLGVAQELHWRLTSNARLLPLADAFWMRRDPVLLGRSEFRTLPDEEMFLYLCVHGSMHVWFRLKWLADVAAILRCAPRDFAEAAAKRAYSLGIARPFHQAIALAHSLLDAPVPPSVLAKATLDRATPGLVAAAYRALNWNGSPSEPSETPWFNMWIALQAYRLRPELGYWWAEFQDQLCSPEDWARLPLPDSLTFLYPGVRPISWVVRKLGQVFGH